jgi:hypothetical protein
VILEYIYRNGFGNVTASVGGLITGIIAHHLILTSTRAGDTMEMMQAVLDTNFWLATHVVTVTIGYTATYLAGILAMLYIILGVFTPVMGQKVAAPESEPKRKVELLHKTVGRMIYGSICFAVMMSFIGTVLGGIWADQSWGRFWGWDPKENGALIIVIWNALILHARWGGMVRERGIAVLAIIGNIVTSWSWFGVNELGAGLHSYGFTDGTVFWLLVFVATQLHLMGMGLIPMGAWRSFTAPSGDNTASESPIATDDRPLPLTIMAYLNVGYSTILAICLIVLYSNPTINSAPRWFLVYLAFGYLFSAGLLYFTTVGLLNRQWRLGFVCGNLAAVFLVSNLLYLELKFNVGGMLLIAPLLLYPIALIFMLNFNYGKVGPGSSGGGGSRDVEPATA